MNKTEISQPVYKHELNDLIREYIKENLEVKIDIQNGWDGEIKELVVMIDGDYICSQYF